MEQCSLHVAVKAALAQAASPGGGPARQPWARSISAFLNAIEAALTTSPVMGPVTNWSSSSLGMYGSAAKLAAMAAFFNFVLIIGIDAPGHNAMPRTQNSGQARLVR